MAYFDSPKNKAKWERELSDLREEKKLRQSGVSFKRKTESTKLEERAKTEASYRVRTSFQELIKEETELLRKPRPDRDKSFDQSLTVKKDKNLQKKAFEVSK